MHHVLDNPGWHALNSGNASLAYGSDEVKFFDLAASPFVGLKHLDDKSFAALAEITPNEGPYLFVSAEHLPIPANWRVINHTPGYQMVYHGGPITFTPKYDLVVLTDEHIPQM